MSIKPSLPKGTRDFGPDTMRKRAFIMHTIKTVFEKYGFQPIETPAIENMSTLSGKYGEEGDKLLFKILNSGDFLAKADHDALAHKDSRRLSSSISEKGLHYDLTVPLARYVVMNQHNIAFPFRRYQMQPVWRADRPQKGRYREFWQCDADVIGSDSLLNEVELVQIASEVFQRFGINVTIAINNRKILAGIAEVCGIPNRLIEFTISLDKLDKIGAEGVIRELKKREFTEEQISKIKSIVFDGNLEVLVNAIQKSETGKKGWEELQYIKSKLDQVGLKNYDIQFQLARGLDYYTGTIFEFFPNNVQMGALGSGGRYDDLTGLFGLKDVSGVGISFGMERIYDVMSEQGLFPEDLSEGTRLLFVTFDEPAFEKGFELLQQVRRAGISAELFPSVAKMKKQMKYADQKRIPFVVLIGSEELETGKYSLKDMKSGEQDKLGIGEIISRMTGSDRRRKTEDGS